MSNKLKISGIVLTLLLSMNGFAQKKQDCSTDSEIVMTKAELESFLKLIAKKKRESLKKEKAKSFHHSIPKENTYSAPITYQKSEFDRINNRIDLLMQSLYFGKVMSAKQNEVPILENTPNKSTTLIPITTDNSTEEKIAYLQSQIDALRSKQSDSYDETDKESEEVIYDSAIVENIITPPTTNMAPQRRSYLENLLDKYQGFKKQVFFANNSDTVSDSDIEYIKEVASILKGNPELSILLKGYASPKGNPEYNKALSMRRAESVMKELKQRGIPDSRIETSFHGEDKNTSEAGARRVDMSVVIK